jgi:Apea-like HEPN
MRGQFLSGLGGADPVCSAYVAMTCKGDQIPHVGRRCPGSDHAPAWLLPPARLAFEHFGMYHYTSANGDWLRWRAAPQSSFWFWIALEALFGPDDSSELSYKLAERIAFFIADNTADARQLFQKSKKCYGVRSKIVHGRYKPSPDIDQMMEDTEAIVRTAFRHLIEKPGMLPIFVSKKRDEYLADLIFDHATH